MIMNELHKEAFREEAYELLTELESALLELEESPDNQEMIGRTFRAMHTIKGSGAMFGFTDIAEFTHDVETVFDKVRGGMISVDKSLIDSTLKSCDLIRAMLEGAGDVDEDEKQRLKEVFTSLARCGTGDGTEMVKTAPALSPPEKRSGEKTYRIRFKPPRDIYLTGTDPVLLLNELRDLGECRVVAHLNEVPSLEEITPEQCYTYWDIILTTSHGDNAIRDVFIFVEEDCELRIDVIDESSLPFDQVEQKKLGQILVERGDLKPEDMVKVLESRKRFGEIVVEKGLAEPSQIEAALAEQQQVREVRQRRQNTETTSSIRVPSEKLDVLVNLVGELVTVQARLTQTAAIRNDSSLTLIAEEVERLTSELRDSTLNIRMMPFGSTFSKFKRLVRDLSDDLGKEVEMITEGANTELDKTVIERLNDPLVHIIRNSIDHGIESPGVREAHGKPRQGTVRLMAEHSGDCVFITIQDDGAGLDKDAIRAKAVEKRLISDTAELSEKEIFGLIFAPGFSTAKKVTGISGRGVGMDVVKQAIEALRGAIEIRSRKGEGTTISIRLPLTLAIIESLLVKIGSDRYVLPLSFVEECVVLTRRDIEDAHGKDLANVRGHMVPYIPLRKRFQLTGVAPDIQQVVITAIDGERVGLLVDTVIGEHQTVIKSLGKAYRNVHGISGATILGDGTVALILDIPQLVKYG
jgi:two-component system chemotaxis sensor kinase CheA